MPKTAGVAALMAATDTHRFHSVMVLEGLAVVEKSAKAMPRHSGATIAVKAVVETQAACLVA